MSLVNEIAIESPELVESLLPGVIELLYGLVMDAKYLQFPENMYYDVPCPWLTVKCLKFIEKYSDRIRQGNWLFFFRGNFRWLFV